MSQSPLPPWRGSELEKSLEIAVLYISWGVVSALAGIMGAFSSSPMTATAVAGFSMVRMFLELEPLILMHQQLTKREIAARLAQAERDLEQLKRDEDST